MPTSMHTEILRARWRIAALQLHVKFLILAFKAGFDPNQPRVSAGNPDGGRWIDAAGQGSDRNPVAEPISETREARALRRKKYVIHGGGNRFAIAPNRDADASAPWYELPILSKVQDYSAEIDRVAKELAVEADLIRTIMFMETTHGHYFFVGTLADRFNVSDSVLPMNISLASWGDTFGGRSKLEVPLNNIRAGATILRGIIGNLPARASVAEIATLYNDLGARMVTDYGARAEAVFRSHLWER